MEYVKCNTCSSDNTRHLISIENAKIVKCNNCDLVYLNPRPTKKELEKLYQKGYYKNKGFFKGKYCGYYDYYKNVEGTIKTFSIVQKNLKKIKQKAKLLDIGCGPGIYLGVAERDGFEVRGLEISKEGFEIAKSKFKVINKTLEEANIKEKFDIITLFDVIEHIPNPKDILLRINKLLNKDGIVCIITPDSNSFLAKLLGSKWPEFKRWREHIYFFSTSTLNRLLENTGFELVKTHTIGKYFILESLINETRIFNEGISNFILRLTKVFGINKLQIYFNPGYKRVFYARKINQ